MKTIFLMMFYTLIMALQILPQEMIERQLRSYRNPDELVTFSPSVTFNQAIQLLNEVSERNTGKQIISTVDNNNPIGLLIPNMDYKQALTILVQMNNLIYEEKETTIIIKRKGEPAAEKTKETYASVDSREVKISAVFFEMNVSESKQRGIDWQFLLSRGTSTVSGEIGLREGEGTGGGGQTAANPEFELGVSSTVGAGGFFGRATAMFKFFESENLGEIISSPNVTVRDRNNANLQIGSDISIKQRDFAGNVIENFYSTGTIIGVTPYVYNEDGLDYVLLDLKVERSSYVPDPNTTIIDKNEAQTQVLMLNGEETIIGGFFTNEQTTIRTGIPFLKDLPWWVLGIRYLAGSDEIRFVKKELVILIKTEIVPTLKERLAWPQSQSPIKDEVLKQREKIQIYKFNQVPSQDN